MDMSLFTSYQKNTAMFFRSPCSMVEKEKYQIDWLFFFRTTRASIKFENFRILAILIKRMNKFTIILSLYVWNIFWLLYCRVLRSTSAVGSWATSSPFRTFSGTIITRLIQNKKNPPITPRENPQKLNFRYEGFFLDNSKIQLWNFFINKKFKKNFPQIG